MAMILRFRTNQMFHFLALPPPQNRTTELLLSAAEAALHIFPSMVLAKYQQTMVGAKESRATWVKE